MSEELRSYEPSWRDYVASLMMGNERASPAHRNFVEGLLGSTGLGHTGTGLVDFTPAGGALTAQEGIQAGDPTTTASGVTSAVAPFSGKAVSGITNLMRQFPRTSAAVGGAAGAGLTTAEAGPRLTRQQERELEIQRRQATSAADLARQEAEARQARELAAEDARRKGQLQGDLDRQRAEAELKQQEALRQSQLPFREKFPNFANSLPFLGMAGAFTAPYLSRFGNTLMRNATIKQMDRSVESARGAATAKDPAEINRLVEELRGYKGMNVPSGKASPSVVAASAAMPLEASLLPQEYDVTMLPPGNPNREAAWHTLTSPTELGKRAVPALMAGAPAALLGSKLPVPLPNRVPPDAEISGFVKALKAPRRRKSGE